MVNFPTVSIGMPVFNGERYIGSTLECLLSQSFSNFEIIVSDNASTDSTLEICRELASHDRRIHIYRNEKNLGQIKNFRNAFQKAHGKYFMWASDHDLWHRSWLETSVEILDKFPQVVLVYPFTVLISDNGEELRRVQQPFETFGLGRMERIKAVCNKMQGAGNLFYGLFRASSLARTSIYPFCMMPDRLLLLELSVQGTFKQIPSFLYFRRYPEKNLNTNSVIADYERLIERGKAILFPEKAVPWHANFPMLSHALSIIYYLSLKPSSGNYAYALLGPYIAFLHLYRKKQFLRNDFRRLVSCAGKKS